MNQQFEEVRQNGKLLCEIDPRRFLLRFRRGRQEFLVDLNDYLQLENGRKSVTPNRTERPFKH